MATEEITLEIGADTGQATTALDEIIALMQDLLASNRAVVTGVTEMGGAFGALTPKPVERINKAAEKQVSIVQLLQTHWRALASAIGALGIGSLFSGVADDARDLRTLANTLGVTTRGLQTLDFAADQAGVSVDAARAALRSLQDQITAASLGDQGAMTNLGFLGLSRSQLANMDAPERFSEVAESLARIEDPARRVGVAMRVFGGSAQELGPLLSKTPDELRALARGFDELGGGLSGELIESMRQWDMQASKVRVSLTTLRAMLAQTLLPVIQGFASAVSSVVRWLQDMNRQMHLLEFGGLAVLLAAMFKLVKVFRTMTAIDLGKTLLSSAKWIGIAVLIAAVAALIQEIIHMFEGGRSVIAEFIDSFSELGKVDGWVRNIKAGWEAMSKMQFPGITEVLDAMHQWVFDNTVMPELQGKIEGIREGIKMLEANTDLPRSVRDSEIARNRAILAEYESSFFGMRGLRAVGRGLASDVQRSGELTTGSLSRFEGGAGSVHINNEIKVEAAAGTREIGQAAARGVDEALRQNARDLQQAVGGTRK